MTLGGLFSGIGGFELAAQWAGITPVWSNEIDPFCCKVLRKNFSHEIIEADIRTIGNGRQHELAPVDIICGGFPCQPFSSAGKRKGKDDNRYLWPEMLRTIREIKPAWVIGENVAGILSMDGGAVFEEICASLENEGYQTEAFIIPACGVGAPHKRDRIWIVANSYRNNDRTNERPNREKDKVQEVNKQEQLRARKSSGTIAVVTHTNGAGLSIAVRGEQRSLSETIGTPARREPGRAFTADQQWKEHWLQTATRICGIFNGFSRSMDKNRLINGTSIKKITGQDMPCLWEKIQQEAVQWEARGRNQIPEPEYLFSVLWSNFRKSYRQDNLLFESKEVQEAFLRNVWIGSKPGCPPQGWRYNEQYEKEHSYSLSQLSHEITLATMEEKKRYNSDRSNRLKALGNAIVPQIAKIIFEAILQVETAAPEGRE